MAEKTAAERYEELKKKRTFKKLRTAAWTWTSCWTWTTRSSWRCLTRASAAASGEGISFKYNELKKKLLAAKKAVQGMPPTRSPHR